MKHSGFKYNVGSRRQVYEGSAHHTSGNMTKSDILKYKGRLVSKKKHNSNPGKHLGQYITEAKKNKGKKGFHPMKKGMFTRKR
jgi:hypothetical protein